MMGIDIVGARDDARRIGRAGRLGRYVLRKDGNGGNGEKGGEDEAHVVTPDFCASVIARLAVPAKAIFDEFPFTSRRTCSGIQRCSRTTAYIAWHHVGPRNKSVLPASHQIGRATCRA